MPTLLLRKVDSVHLLESHLEWLVSIYSMCDEARIPVGIPSGDPAAWRGTSKIDGDFVLVRRGIGPSSGKGIDILLPVALACCAERWEFSGMYNGFWVGVEAFN